MTSHSLEVRDLHVTRGSVRALRGATMTVPAGGVVHALLGANGSGKSTMLAVVSGQLQKDSGEVIVDGVAAGADDAAVAMVSQELALAADLCVYENVMMGRLIRRFRRIDRRASAAAAAAVLEQLGVEIDVMRRTGELRPDEQQLVEIARALAMRPRILILDEPTSSLSSDEVAGLFAVLRRLKAAGTTTVLVSHRLPELFEICDSITVLRDGVDALEAQMDQVSEEDIVAAMVGPEDETVRGSPDRQPVRGRAVLEIRGLGDGKAFRDVTMDVAQGEIVGLAGLTGSGCSEVLEVLYGLRDVSTGSVSVGGNRSIAREPEEAMALGLAYLPPDRKTMGLNLTMTIADNLAIAASRHRPRLGRPRRPHEAREAATVMEQLRMSRATPSTLTGSLSGGNQQKVALGRCTAASPRVCLLDEPTRGVDVRARQEIHERLRSIAAEGAAILVTSTDHEELLHLCDRVAVMVGGVIVSELEGADLTDARLATAAGGGAAR